MLWKADNLFNKVPHEPADQSAIVHGVFLRLLVAVTKFLAEQERSTPQARKSDNGVDNAAKQCVLSTKDPRNEIELKDTHKAPVCTANDR